MASNTQEENEVTKITNVNLQNTLLGEKSKKRPEASYNSISCVGHSLHSLMGNCKIKPDVKLSLARKLIERGADVNAKNKYKDTPLHLAIFKQEDDKILRLLLDAGADVDAINDNGHTPLHLLVLDFKRQHAQVCKRVIDRMTNIDVKNFNGNTPLHQAVARDEFMFKLLLSSGADVHSTNANGDTPFMCAVKMGKVKVIQALVDNGVQLNDLVDKTQKSPLQIAYDHRQKAVMKCLLKNGFNVNYIDNEGYSFLMSLLLQLFEPDLEIVKFLLKHRADVNVLSPSGKNILYYWVDGKISDCRRIILEHIAKLYVIGLPVHESLIESITEKKSFNDYFDKCKQELLEAKSLKIGSYKVTFLNLLMEHKSKLGKYARNRNLVEEFEKIDTEQAFPIFGAAINKRFFKTIQRQKLWNNAAAKLSRCLPVVNQSHLIVQKVLDYLDTDDLKKLSL